MTVFTTAPQVTVIHGRDEICVVDPMMIPAEVAWPSGRGARGSVVVGDRTGIDG